MYTCSGAFVYDCAICPTPCDGISKGTYDFQHDVSLSEHFEQLIIDRINRSGKYAASKSTQTGYPDITLRDDNSDVCKYIEIKVQQRTFMNVQTALPASDLTPSETMALNESDLVRYIEIEEHDQVPIFILWVLQNRRCIVGNSCQYYYQQLSQLKQIYRYYGAKRRFKRRSGNGDVVDGQHKGVVVNYHFSLKELKRWE